MSDGKNGGQKVVIDSIHGGHQPLGEGHQHTQTTETTPPDTKGHQPSKPLLGPPPTGGTSVIPPSSSKE